MPEETEVREAAGPAAEARAGAEGERPSSNDSVEETAGEESSLKHYFLRWITIRDQPGQVESLLAAVICIALVLLIWEILTAGAPEQRIVDTMTLPSPSETLDSFKSLWFDRALARSTVWSLGRVLGGFLLAASIAIPLGICASSFRRLRALFRPLSVFGRNVPIAALIPLTLIWFGLGETQKVMFIFLSCVAFIYFDTTTAVDSVPDSYLDTAYTLGAKFVPKHGLTWAAIIGLAYAVIFGLVYFLLVEAPTETDPEVVQAAFRNRAVITVVVGLVLGFALWFPIMSMQVVRKVLLPLGLPDIVNSLRLLFGLAFGYIMLAEVINAKAGLGYIIILSQRKGPREHIYLVLIIIAVLAFAIDRLILYAQRWLFPYRETEGR